MKRREFIVKCGVGLAGIIAAGRAPAAVVKGMLGATGERYTMADESNFPYVTKGLIAMWDGEWNAGYGIHDPTLHTWKNLVSSKWNLSLGTAATWIDNAVCNQGNDLVGFITESTDTLDYADFRTIEMVFEWDGTVFNESSKYALLFSMSKGRPNGRVIVLDNQTPSRKKITVENCIGASTYSGSQSIPLSWCTVNEIHHISAIYPETLTEGTCQFLFDSKQAPYDWRSSADLRPGLKIGGDYITQRFFHGKIYCIRVYNRELSDIEISANYVIDKVRFNLQ